MGQLSGKAGRTKGVLQFPTVQKEIARGSDEISRMSVETNKQQLCDFIDEVWNQGWLELIPGFVTRNYLLHHPSCPIHGIEALADFIRQYRTGFPDLHLEVEEVLAGDDRVFARYTLTGTHDGPLLGHPPSGCSVVIPGLSLVHMVDGKLREEWSQWDSASAMQQIGSFTPGPSRPALSAEPRKSERALLDNTFYG